MNLSAFFPFGTYGLDLSLPPAHLRTDLWLQLCFFSRVTALSLSFLLLFYLLFLSLFYIFIVLSFFVLQSVCIPSHALRPNVYEALSSTFALPSALPLLFNVQGMQWPRRCWWSGSLCIPLWPQMVYDQTQVHRGAEMLANSGFHHQCSTIKQTNHS